MSEKQDRQGVRKASELEQKYNFGRSFDKVNGAVVAAMRAATNANAAASSANTAASSANAAAEEVRRSVEEINEELLQVATQVDFVITGTLSEDGLSVELDKSFAEILEAVKQKRKCTVVIGDDSFHIFELVFANARQIRFQQLTRDGVLVSLEISSDEE